ncbi:MAG: GNAT family protein [Pseudomonadota bacterium]
MTAALSPSDLSLGAPVPDWTPPTRPSRSALAGRFARLEPLSLAQADGLFEAYAADREGRLWTYLSIGPFETLEAYRDWVAGAAGSEDPLFFAVLVEGRPLGVLSYLRINPEAGSIEVGWITLSPALQRTPAATEIQYLMMRWAFEAGYRRYEWKCNALNAASRRAAQRFGFSFEGVHRQAQVSKGRNRDTAWYAVIDREWPALKIAFETWLGPENFDADGRQKAALRTLTAPLLVSQG